MKTIYQSIRQHNRTRSTRLLLGDAAVYWLLFGLAFRILPILIDRIGVTPWLIPVLVVLIAIIPGSAILGTMAAAEVVTRWVKIK